MFDNIKVINPKIIAKEKSFTKYYAGYNNEFARTFINSSKLNSSSVILDPWNGVGTTTLNANQENFRSIGCDINPVMAIYAKANLFKPEDVKLLLSLRDEIINQVLNSDYSFTKNPGDPLLTWFSPEATKHFRHIEFVLRKLLLSEIYDTNKNNFEEYPSLVCFFYVGIFQSLRALSNNFRSSNPTWIKRPKDKKARIRPSRDNILSTFRYEIDKIIKYTDFHNKNFSHKEIDIRVKSSVDTGISDNSVDLVLTSPPYCTRIDYAISTQIELSFLGFDLEDIKKLRNKMIGTSTIYNNTFQLEKKWGERTNDFLDQVYNHHSKASSTYYFKSHYQYYDAMYKSLLHIAENILKPNGGMALVVQDSFYKEIHNNLQENLIDMASKIGYNLEKKFDFKSKKTMANINSKSMNYRTIASPKESVICFTKK